MLLEEIGFNLKGPSLMLEDNAAAKSTAETIGISDANKHIKVKFHWLRQCIQEGIMKLMTVASKANAADALTKAPTRETLTVMMNGSGMRAVESIHDDQPDQGG